MVFVFRRLISMILAALFILSLSSAALAANTMQQGSMYVNTENGKALRFRSSKATAKDNILAEIPYGTKVYVLDWDGTWARIRYNSAIGYVVKKYLSIARPEPYSVVSSRRAEEAVMKELEKDLKAADRKLDHSRLQKVITYDVTVRTGVEDLTANAYDKPSLTAVAVAGFEEGARLEVTAVNRDWAEIFDGATGITAYMLLEDLEIDVIENELLEDDG